jgi:hypothetical protein
MNETPKPSEVTNKLTTVADSSRAADLFARILRAVREQREDEANRSKEQPQQAA